MTVINVAPSSTGESVDEIEQQIAKVSAELALARDQQFAAAEEAVQVAQLALTAAVESVNDLISKPSNTPTAQKRLLAAQALAQEQERALSDAKDILDELKAERKIAKKIALALTGKKLGKKIKFSKKEKEALKLNRKKAKKNAKADKKAAKQDEKNALKLSESKANDAAILPEAANSEVAPDVKPNVIAKKPVAKKPMSKTPSPIKRVRAPARKKSPVASTESTRSDLISNSTVSSSADTNAAPTSNPSYEAITAPDSEPSVETADTPPVQWVNEVERPTIDDSGIEDLGRKSDV